MSARFIDIFYPQLNFISRERVDPLLGWVLEIFQQQNNFQLYVLAQYLIYFFGLFLLFYQLGSNRNKSWLTALTGCCILFFFGQIDPLISKIAWFPFLIWSINYFLIKKSFLAGSFAWVFICLWAYTAGSFGVFGGILAIIFSMLSLGQTTGSTKGDNKIILSSLLLLIVLSISFLPVFPMPDYPWKARLVPISQKMFQPQPYNSFFLDPDPTLNSRLEMFIGYFLLKISLILLALGFLIKFNKKHFKNELGQGIFILLITSLILLFEASNNSFLHQISPFQMFRRLIPGIGLSELPWLIVPYGMTLAFIGLLKNHKTSFYWILIGLCFLGVKITDSSKLTWKVCTTSKDLKCSPSAYVIEVYGDWVTQKGIAEKRMLENLHKIVQGKDANWTLHSNIKAENLVLATDGNPQTRWATARPQKPGDWVNIQFDRLTPVLRVVLSIRNYSTDFPRGLKVLGSNDGINFYNIVNFPDWIGPVKWSKKGFPFFGDQADVTIDFPAIQKVKELKFIQTSQQEKYDWSIGELELYN